MYYMQVGVTQFFQLLMATAMSKPVNGMTATIPTARRVCFSFAAYAKNVIGHLRNCNLPIDEGLSDLEFSHIQSTFGFTFPPDLRSILQEGLPVGLGFPNWRSSSTQQLQVLTNLPILGICKEVARRHFWLDSWGRQPDDADDAVKLAKAFLKKAPVLVPIYQHCYIPSAPDLAGNPVFYVNGSRVKLSSFDVAGFFQQVNFRLNDGGERGPSLWTLINAPAWAATEARRIEFWTEMEERGGERVAARDDTPPLWWSGDLRGCLEEACWMLREGGWKEEEVCEMMMMDGCDVLDNRGGGDKESVAWHVRVLSLRLLRAGWSTEDVGDSLGFYVEDGVPDQESSKSYLLEA